MNRRKDRGRWAGKSGRRRGTDIVISTLHKIYYRRYSCSTSHEPQSRKRPGIAPAYISWPVAYALQYKRPHGAGSDLSGQTNQHRVIRIRQKAFPHIAQIISPDASLYPVKTSPSLRDLPFTPCPPPSFIFAASSVVTSDMRVETGAVAETVFGVYVSWQLHTCFWCVSHPLTRCGAWPPLPCRSHTRIPT